MTLPKLVAFHLPQFHTIPENDEWWGKGFTEWTKVKASTPLFAGHAQPREPLNDNYYDLSNHQSLCDQAAMASEYGIHAFCFYHYWFKGRRLLEKPLEKMLEEKSPDFPFILSWANEPWTRAWNEGTAKEVLMPLEYGNKQDWTEHFTCLLRFFLDPRYVKKNNRPMLLIFKPELIPCFQAMSDVWDKLAKQAGFDGIEYVRMLTFFSDLGWSHTKVTQNVEFEPGFAIANTLPLRYRIARKFKRLGMKLTKGASLRWRRPFIQRYAYEVVSAHITKRSLPSAKKVYHGVFVDWDNTPRRAENGLILEGSTPEIFGDFLMSQVKKSMKANSEFVFINAWNEWAEGAHLEPDKKNEFGYLNQVKRVLVQAAEDSKL